MTEIDSEAIGRIEYDAPSQTLFVRFAGGQWYAYLAVPRKVADGLETAGSHGRFFQTCIRGRYGYRRLDLSSS